MNDILDLHIKHDYIIKIQVSDNKQVRVRIPNNFDLSLPENMINYRFNPNSIEIVRNGTDSSIPCPNYSVRPIIIADILVEIDRYEISPDLIVFYKDKERAKPENGLMDLISVFDKEDTALSEKETAMTYVIAKILTGDLDIQEYTTKMDIEEGVSSLFRLLEGD